MKAHYGIRAEKLAEFGIKPFRGRKPAPVVPPDPEPEPEGPPPTIE